MKHEASIKIQKIGRGYITRKQAEQIKQKARTQKQQAAEARAAKAAAAEKAEEAGSTPATTEGEVSSDGKQRLTEKQKQEATAVDDFNTNVHRKAVNAFIKFTCILLFVVYVKHWRASYLLTTLVVDDCRCPQHNRSRPPCAAPRAPAYALPAHAGTRRSARPPSNSCAHVISSSMEASGCTCRVRLTALTALIAPCPAS